MADTNTYISKQKTEKWTTKEKFNALDLSDIPVGTEYNLSGQIDESDLDDDLKKKINGKLTAPTTPTADSAVTMLADGTVGTKPLSEIGGGSGGGGGKLYVHSITIKADNNTRVIKGNFLSTRGTNYNVTDDFKAYFLPGSTITIDNVTYGITYYANQPSNGYREYESFNITTYEGSGGPVYNTPTFNDYYVTEL